MVDQSIMHDTRNLTLPSQVWHMCMLVSTHTACKLHYIFVHAYVPLFPNTVNCEFFQELYIPFKVRTKMYFLQALTLM